jgi:hypothetical protein
MLGRAMLGRGMLGRGMLERLDALSDVLAGATLSLETSPSPSRAVGQGKLMAGRITFRFVAIGVRC